MRALSLESGCNAKVILSHRNCFQKGIVDGVSVVVTPHESPVLPEQCHEYFGTTPVTILRKHG